jgi:hypothetical protein
VGLVLSTHAPPVGVSDSAAVRTAAKAFGLMKSFGAARWSVNQDCAAATESLSSPAFWFGELDAAWT